MGWSDLPSDLVISIASHLPEPGHYARFRAICTSWESAVRGFRPAFFPWLAVIPNKKELSFISHAGNDCVYKRPMPCGNIILEKSCVSSNKDGWMMFVRHDLVRYEPIIVNPLTGAQLQHLPSLYTLFEHCLSRKRIDSVVFFPDNHVAFVECCVNEDYHILAAATPGDDEWSGIRLSPSYFKNSIVFHEADRKFYVMCCEGEMRSFRLTRCGGKTVFGEISSTLAKATTTLAKATRQKSLLFVSHLMSDGPNLLQVRKRFGTTEFEILKYCPDADMWVKMTNMDYLGNNSLFFDRYGARMLPLPLPQRDGRPRRNCRYFTDYEIENHECVTYVRIYDVGKGTVESCFSTNIQSNGLCLPALMWFTPSLSVKN